MTVEKHTISTSMAPEVIIERVTGNLRVRGWDHPQVVVIANPDDLEMVEQDDEVRLSCQGGCDLRVPQGATLQVENVGGNAQFVALEDQITIGEVHGSLSLRGVGAAQVDTVHGELRAKALSGDLQGDRIYGNAHGREVQGACSLGEVHGNLDLRNVEGDVEVSAKGNARVRLSTLAGTRYQIQAEGNLHCRIPANADLKLSLSSEAETIRVKLPEDFKTYREASCELALGGGEIPMEISAGGALYLVGEQDWDDTEPEFSFGEELPDEVSQQIAQQVEAQLQAQMEAMSQQINEQMARLTEKVSKSGLTQEQTEQIMEQALQASERETARAQEKIRRAQEKLERRLETAQRRSRGRTRRTWDFELSTPAAPAKQVVSEEERLMILRMLEQKKISLEEAEQLLAALEGE